MIFGLQGQENQLRDLGASNERQRVGGEKSSTTLLPGLICADGYDILFKQFNFYRWTPAG